MKRAWIEGNNIKIKFSFPRGDKTFFEILNKIKLLNGRRFIPEEKLWTCPKILENVAGLTKMGFNIQGLEGIAKKEPPKIEIKIKRIRGFLKELRHYQLEAVNFVEDKNGRALIADEMGLGKTIETLAWLQYKRKDAFPTIIVSPATAKGVWLREIHECWDQLPSIEIFSGRKMNRYKSNSDIIIVNYDILKGRLPEILASNPKTLIMDECHAVRTHTAQRTEATTKLASFCKYVIGLSGTPIENRPIEFHSIINMINPTIFPKRYDFGKRYCDGQHDGYGWNFKGASNIPELYNTLTEKLMIRRKKSEVLTELPAKVREIIPFEVDNWDEYEEIEDNVVKWITENEGLEKAKRASNAEYLVTIRKLQQAAFRGKLKSVLKWIEEFLESGEKLIVFCCSHFAIDTIKEKFKDTCVVIDGRVSKGRNEIEKRFQTDEKINLFIGELTAGGQSITLTASSNVSFVEYSFNPAKHLQAEDRCILEGQPVLTPNGWIPIEEIKKGCEVITQNGTISKVVDTWNKQLRKPVTELKIEGYYKSIKITHDHLILKDNGNWIEASKLIPGDNLKMPVPHIDKNLWHIPFDKDCRIKTHFQGSWGWQKNARLVKAPKRIVLDNETLFVLGYYAGDGHSVIEKDKSRGICFSGNTTTKKKSLERIKKWLTKNGIGYGEYTRENSIEVKGYSGEWAFWFRKHFGHTAKNKKLPYFIHKLSSKQCRYLLEGLMASDGYQKRKRKEYVTASQNLAGMVYQVILKAGYKPCLTTIKPSKGRLQMYILGFTKGVSQYQKVESIHSYFIDKRKGIKVYDLTIDNDPSFVVGTTIVHNCHRFGQKDSVTSYYLMAEKTIEENMIHVIKKKMEIIEGVLDGETSDSNVFEEILNNLKSKPYKAS